MSFPKHAEYKESGNNWLDRVPAHWEVSPCRAIVIERSVRNENSDCEDYLSLMANIGVIPYADKGDIGNKKPEDLSKCKMVHKGDFVINSMNYYIGSYGISSYDGVCSPVYIVLTPRSDVVDSRYAFRIFEDKRFQEYAQSFGNGILEHRRSINWDILKTIPVPIPPPDEQKLIASYLDVETSKIDSLVSEQRRLVQLLKEKRQAVISHAVTKGLNPESPMKPSGIKWLGDVPQHWIVATVRRVLASIEQGWSPQCESRSAGDHEWGILKTGCVNRGIFSEAQNKALPDDLEPITEYEVKAGDVLMSRASGSPELVGATAFVREVRPHLMLSDKTFRVHLTDGMAPEYFVAVFKSQMMRSQIEQSISGAEGLANNLPQSKLKCYALAIPPISEQVEIVRVLDLRCQRFDALQAEAARAIESLRERRTALITAAVTGKIDVRELGSKEAV